jgi:hypothetical protein
MARAKTTIINPARRRPTKARRSLAPRQAATGRVVRRRRRNPDLDPRFAVAAGALGAVLAAKAARSMLGAVGQNYGDILVLALAALAMTKAKTPAARSAAGGMLAGAVVLVAPRVMPKTAALAGAVESRALDAGAAGVGVLAAAIPMITGDDVAEALSGLGAVYREDSADFAGPYGADASDFAGDDDDDDFAGDDDDDDDGDDFAGDDDGDDIAGDDDDDDDDDDGR